MRLRILAIVLSLLVVVAIVEQATAGRKKGTFVYVHDLGSTKQVLGFELGNDGTLTPLAGSPFAATLVGGGGCGGFCQTMGYSTKRKMLVTAGGDGLEVWNVESGGALTAGPTLTGVLDADNGVEVIDVGRRTFVYANDYGDDEVHGFELASDGTLTALDGSPWSTGDGPNGIVHAKGKALFCMNERGHSVSAYAIAKDGTLTAAAGSPFAVATPSAWNLQVDAKSKSVYVGDYSAGAVFGFAIDKRTAALTALAGSPFAVDVDDVGSGVSFAKKGPAFVMPYSPGSTGFQAVRRAKDGSLTSFAAPQSLDSTQCQAHARSLNGKVLLIAGGGGLRSYAVNRKTGALTLRDTAAFDASQVNDIHVVRR